VVTIEAGRSPIGKKKGALSSAHPTELLAQLMAEVLKRAKVRPPPSARQSAAASTRLALRRLT
jgi:acetyl-CoA acetyltransferase